MRSLEDLIAASLEGRSAVVEALVFKTEDPGAIASLIGDACSRYLGAAVEAGTFYIVSVGCVAGVGLDNGRQVVIKAYQPRWSATFLSAVGAAQARLADGGFPCARPIVGPVPIGRSHVMIEEHLEDPGPSLIEPSTLGVSAAGLADLVSRLRRVDPSGFLPHPMDQTAGALYPEPHSPIFDFVATAAGAEWIDELASAALRVRDATAGPLTVAHCDWSLRNVRVDSERLVAVYDWDSLAAVRETTAVGQAAATWTSHDGGPDTVPTVEEIADYADQYERARGQAFSPPERSRIGAAALWNLTYIARCEHAIDPEEEVHRRARTRLAADGDRLLGLADLLDGPAGLGGGHLP